MTKQFPVLAGPCVIEDEGLVLEIAQELSRQLRGLEIDFYFKASFDKANRTSIDGFRGPGLVDGLKTLQKVKSQLGLKVVTDFHTPDQAAALGEIVDCLQIPAFLCRQTDLVVAGAEAAIRHGRKLNVKKGQFLAPWDAKNIVDKVSAVNQKLSGERLVSEFLYLTERGVSFGYNSLIVDMTSFQYMNQLGVPTIYDATHSVQSPGAGAGGKSTGGKRENIEVLARAAMAAGATGVFLECHPDPSKAKSDGPNAFFLEHVGTFVRQLLAINKLVSDMPKVAAP